MKFNKDAFLSLIEGDKELANQLVDMFEKDWPTLLEELGEAIEKGQHKQVEQLAHRLKGTLRNFYAEEVASLAEKLESSGRNNDLSGIQSELQKMGPLLEELQTELSTFCQSL